MFLPLALVKLNLLSDSMGVLYSTGAGEQLLTYASTLIFAVNMELIEPKDEPSGDFSAYNVKKRKFLGLLFSKYSKFREEKLFARKN